jgi:hypothetical protein
MAGIGNNLYPPIISTFMPAFQRDGICKVYFSLSSYNDKEDISSVQIVISNQNTNLTALSTKKYPAGIKITSDLNIDESVNGDDKYYVEISAEDLESGIFELNQFYKVQIRFTGVNASTLNDNSKIAAWLTNNQSFFSEWSTVCLIKGIEKPTIYLKGFEDITSSTNKTVFTSEVLELVGSMYFEENTDEKEYLKYYNVNIYKTSDESLVFSSGSIYTNVYNPNEINYTLPYELEDGTEYQLVFTYVTINEYSDSLSYVFSVIQNTIGTLNATITAEEDVSNGRVKIEIKSTNSESFFGNLIIRRTSNKSNFTIWEDIHQTTIANGEMLDYIWYDYTIESGIWYRYCAQQKDSKGNRGTIINIRYPIMIELDDMFLTREGMQFKIKYNPEVSSFKTTYTEAKTDTIGSQYPYIRRNGNVKYKQFPISGLITAFCDEDNIFLSKDIIYGENASYYSNYNSNSKKNEYNDYIYERFFREKIMDFLYEDNIKLFRSNTEGNVLVRLMDINFTPNTTLGRMLYSFSATAYEMDDCTLENFESYGIQTIGTYSTNLEYNYNKIGQLIQEFAPKEDLFTDIEQKYKNMTLSKYINTLQSIKWLRVEFDSDPYLINVVSGTPTPVTDSSNIDKDTIYGYIIYINNKPIIVNQRRFYELIDEDAKIISVYFPVTTSATVDYLADLVQTENTKLSYTKMYFYTKVGQIHGLFDVNESCFTDIYLKYYLDYEAYKQLLTSIDEMTVEAEPGTVIYVKDSFDEDYFKHEVGPSGVLSFYDDEASISGFYFAGMQLYNLNSGGDVARDNEFILTNQTVKSTDEIINPIKNGVYIVNNQRYIYYREAWYKFSNDNIVQCPVYALVDYTYEMMKGEY